MSDRTSYYSKISLRNKSPEEAERITKLFNDNINIAYKIASKYYKTDYWEYDEALQIAQMGLWKACLIWDPDKYRISTLAYNVINRDFIDFDKQQKRQPDILFNLEDNIVTDDLSLSDVLVDENADMEVEYVNDDELNELNQDIIYILEDIADDMKLSSSIVKAVYLIYIEAANDDKFNLKSITFVPRSTVKQIIAELQIKLQQLK